MKSIINAFASVYRENFLGPGPSKIRTKRNYALTQSNDPSFLYQDVLVELPKKAHVNNGQPSLHAGCINALRIETGDSVVHIGAGTGYYTAILVELVGQSGSVIAYEIDEESSSNASRNLRNRPNVNIQACSGADSSIPECDVIYVNAGVTGPV